MSRHSARSAGHTRHHEHSSSNRVLRTFTFVLTPFLISVIICSILVIALAKPYGKIKPYFDMAFSAGQGNTIEENVASLNKYKDDDAPLQIKDIEMEDGEVHTMIYPYVGDLYAHINCKNAGMNDIPVYSGTLDDILARGAAWYNGSVYIGHVGNVVIAGHNHTDFYHLPQCEVGDEVTLETDYCKLTYIVREKVVFQDTDLTYVRPTEDDILTMYTCWNNGRLGMSDKRLAVICDCVSREWKEVKQKQ
ncbi:MAG: class D sortase [Ruminococcus sp.]|nr:class D sortase [Ruminococcus sp.]